MKKVKIFVNCSGGVVQGVLSNDKNVSVTVCDWDDYDEDSRMKRSCNRMEKLEQAGEIVSVW